MHFKDKRKKHQKITDYGVGVIFGFSVLLMCTIYLTRQNLKHSLKRRNIL